MTSPRGTRAAACSLAALAVLWSPSAAASPDAVVVFNEVQYNPRGASEAGEWFELFNQMGIRTDISGWRVDGVGYTFPAGTVVEPGGYIVVAKTPGSGELGPFTGSIDNSGERLRLYNQGGRLMDELDFGDGGRWPAAADGSGATLAKRDPYTACGPPGNWAASAQAGGTPGGLNFPDPGAPPASSTAPLVVLGDTWRYNESGADLGAGWAGVAHPVGGDWASGTGGLGSESGATIPLGTALTFPGFNSPYVVTYYFEREFELSAGQLAGLQSLQLRHGFDDGAVIYLNGAEVLRVNMPTGAVTAATLASGGVEVTALSAGVPLPTGALVAGTNRISVELHQESVGSSDVVFGLELDAEVAAAAPGTEPGLLVNELPAAAESPYWVEIVNAGASPVDLAGVRVSAAGDPAREHALPAGQLAAGALLLLDEATLGFRPVDGEKVFLYGATGIEVFDGREVTGRLRGLAAGRGDAWLYPSAATPGAANVFTFNGDVVISEIAYNPPALPATPAVEVPLVAMGDIWRYNDADADLPVGWAASAHPVGGGWKSGAAPVGWESGTLPVPLATVLTGYSSATVTYYFETDFTVSPEVFAGAGSLEITHLVDDGAVFYLNGVRVGDFNLSADPAGPETPANPGVTDAALRTLVVPADNLLSGANRLSVEVHQTGTTSSDVVFGAALSATVGGQPLRNSDNQWIELANRGAAPVDLGGWDFGDGVNFTFPAGTTLAAGEHACVARDAALFTAAYPGARLLGEFSGSLSRKGERVLLRDANKNPADEVHYYEGGRWPGAADGGGSTLELRDLDADNATAGAWAASDEAGRTAWRTYSYRETAANSRGPDNQWREFNLGLLGAGEVLIDDISVVEDPDGAAVQRLTDTAFDNAASWRMIGNHRHSEIVSDSGNKVLRLVATGPTEHIHNQVQTPLAVAISNGLEYEISFRARWVSGSRLLHTRLYFNRCANVNVIDRPADVGTPSAPNSRAEPNIGPTYAGLAHSPVVPAAGQAVEVSATLADPDGVASATLFYSVDGGAFQSVAMVGGPGGLYSGQIPGQAAGSVVAFYLAAADVPGASSTVPEAGVAAPALYEVDDGLAATSGQHNFRIVMTAADSAFQRQPIEVMSNDRLNATVIDREGEIYYGCGVRLKSSERGRNQTTRVGYNVRFPADRLYRGIHPVAGVDRSESQVPGQRELLFDLMISNSGGIISRYFDFIKLLAPDGSLTGGAVLQTGRYDEVFLDSQFENGSDGQVYEYELIYYPTTADAGGFKLPYPNPDGVIGVPVTDLGNDPESYRWFFLNKIGRERDDFAPIMAYAKQFTKSGAAFEDGLGDVVDVDGWLRGMAYAVITGAGDNAGAGDRHNGMYFARPDGRVIFLPHDMDFAAANSGGSTTRSIFANSECAKLTGDPARRRIYLGHLHDIATTTFNSSYMSAWTTHLASLDPNQNWAGKLPYIDARSNNVLSQISGQIAQVAFSISTPSPLTVAASTATVSGDGWVNVREIRLAGAASPLAVTWTDGDSWQVALPVAPGQATYTLEAVDFSGAVIGTDTITIDNTSPVEPASAANIAVSELMYHPAAPTAAEVAAGFTDDDAFEYIELMNIGTNPVDLTGASFTSGIAHALPAATVAPGARVVLARNRAAFLSRHPGAAASLLAGEYGVGTGNKLDNGGEGVVLADALGADIRRFSYGDSAPWPSAPDGGGPSLTLISPASNPDHSVAANWRPSTAAGGSPGGSDATTFGGTAGADADGNGLDDLLDYALGHAAGSTAGLPALSVAGGVASLSFRRNLAADDVVFRIESSTDLGAWVAAAATPVSQVDQGGGVVGEVWQLVPPPGEVRWFVRVVVSPR